MGIRRSSRQAIAASPSAAHGRLAAVAGVLILVALAAAENAGATGSCPRHGLHAQTVRHLIVAGREIPANSVVVGTLHIPAEVRTPLTLRHVTLCGPLIASSVSFDKLVDFTGSRFRAGADFSAATFNGPAVFTGIHTWGTSVLRVDFATFRGLALFGGALIRGHATFANTAFSGPTRFRNTRFMRSADFGSAWFGDMADFSSIQFTRSVDFSGAEFRSVASFSGSSFQGKSAFVAARFSQFADFSATNFGGYTPKPKQTLFSGARLDEGASFLDSNFYGPASFSLAQSGGDLAFDGTDFERALTFTGVDFRGDTTFARASIRDFVNFDEADVHELDLDGAQFFRSAAILLPQSDSTTAHLDELRFDPGDIRRIGVGEGRIPDSERVKALALVETEALRGGDAKAANQAQYLRWTLLRHHRWFGLRFLDWLVMWSVGGYLVAPWNQVAVLLALLLAATTVRVFDPRLHGAPRDPLTKSFGTSFERFWRFKIRDGTARAQAEATVYTLVIVVFLLNLANVWPTGHDLVKGVLP